MNRKKKKKYIYIYIYKRDNLHFIPNNILTKFFKELIKYINDYQQQAKMAKKKKKLVTLVVGSTLTSEKFESFLLKKIKYYS